MFAPGLWEQGLNVMREVADWLATYDKELVACRYTFPESRSVLSVLQIASFFVQEFIRSARSSFNIDSPLPCCRLPHHRGRSNFRHEPFQFS